MKLILEFKSNSFKQPCDYNPCINGICSVVNSSSYSCQCFQPFTGTNCETKLSLCNFINCGQGSCVIRNSSLFDDVYCNCLPGFTGQYCNLKIENQGCLSSPCKNGATCINLDNGTYKCNCTPEYIDTNCGTRKLNNFLFIGFSPLSVEIL